MSDITYHNKDVASKVTGEALIGQTLAPFGLPNLKIVDMLPTNLPTIESNELRLDNLFLLSDGSLAIIDYELDFSRENFVKYLNYIARVVKRYSLQKKLNELREIRMVVIYTADVEYADEVFDLGGMKMYVESAYLVNLNSNHIYQKLRYKIENKEPLNEEELTELMILPLTAKGDALKREYIEKAINLAKQLPRHEDTKKVIMGILTFTDKIIDQDYARKIREEYFMLTQVERMVYEECWEKAQKDVQEKVQKEIQEKVQKEVQEKVQKEVQEKVQKEMISTVGKVFKRLNLPESQFVEILKETCSCTEEEALTYAQTYWA